MAVAGSPKKFAQDISEGYLSLSPPVLRPYTPADLKTILAHLALVSREIRQQQIPPEESAAAKAKNMKLLRLHQAEVVVRSFCKKKRIPL